jgi:hypothetical protein
LGISEACQCVALLSQKPANFNAKWAWLANELCLIKVCIERAYCCLDRLVAELGRLQHGGEVSKASARACFPHSLKAQTLQPRRR